jgi:uncharacterized membrane protein
LEDDETPDDVDAQRVEGSNDEVVSSEPEASPLDTDPGGEHTWRQSLDGIEVGDTLGMQLFKVTIPFAIPAAIFAVLFFVMTYDNFLNLGFLALSYLFPPLGKESIIPLGIAEFGFTKWHMMGLLTMVDVVCAMFISWNLPLAKKIPLIGRLITWIEKKGSESLEKNPGLRSVSWIGLVLWVMVPFQGSGGITASVIGRAIGMRASHVISAVGVGAIIGTFLIGTAVVEGIEAIEENWVEGILMIALIAGVAFVMYLLYKRYTDKKNKEAIERENAS